MDYRASLLTDLSNVSSTLSDLHRSIAYMRVCEIRDKSTARDERIKAEGERDALIERKFLLIHLLNNYDLAVPIPVFPDGDVH